ncbi:glycosyltransferase, partial [Acinetobacter baumannii]
LAEGFGLPLAEAMSLGTPCLTSDRGALAEIAGEAALTIDPLDNRALTMAIEALDSDSDLRARLAAAGLRRAPCFSAERFRERMAAVY